LTVVFLDAENETLLSRYKQTRRSHPLMISNRSSSLLEAIDDERNMAEPISKLANIVIDTTLLKPAKLQDKLEIYFHKGNQETFRISFVSFGYKHGVPRDADLLLDVRFLPNPFYIEELRNKTGNDKEVYDYVMQQPETIEFIEKTTVYYDYLLKKYEEEGKMQMIIGVGCTGGQHRSVTLANYLAEYYSQYYQVYKWHRDAHH
ncbi:MAG: RNase adapter RapZ, partial [Coprobacillus sp.]|nr:RNase adapter RapZ [Coprobacillus sp.]